jgi:hypothetical protein
VRLNGGFGGTKRGQSEAFVDVGNVPTSLALFQTLPSLSTP